ncbi:MAG: hypothetical protein GXC73_11365, partial [Chitinophagaceae bacterium]|nr:hypothetical protein [Chitinophagaceae bacterium]
MKLIFFLMMIFISCKTYSQQVLIENSQSRILYAGVENPLKIHVHGYKPSELTIVVSHGEIIRKDNIGSYAWKICEVNNQFRSILKLYKGPKLVDSVVFRLKPLPEPTILVPQNGHRSNASQIFKMGIRAEIVDFIIEGIRCEIVSYDFGFQKKTDSVFRIITNKGAYFDKSVQDLTVGAASGDKYL